jgi:hypothetical protein
MYGNFTVRLVTVYFEIGKGEGERELERPERRVEGQPFTYLGLFPFPAHPVLWLTVLPFKVCLCLLIL